MGEILTKQHKFSRMLPRLIDHIHDCGYECSLGWLQRSEEDAAGFGKKNSLHTIKLAIDITLFDKADPSKPLTDSADYRFAGEYWESLGGSWGGRFSSPDGNHFSVSHNGIR